MFDPKDGTTSSYHALLLGRLDQREDGKYGFSPDPQLRYRSHQLPFVFFSQDGQFNRQLLVVELALDGVVGARVDRLALLSRLGAEALESTCLPDAGQIGREEPFPALRFATGFVSGLRLQVDLKLLLSG